LKLLPKNSKFIVLYVKHFVLLLYDILILIVLHIAKR